MEGILKSVTKISHSEGIKSQAELDFSQKLISDLKRISEQLNDVNNEFNLISDNELIEALIYQELALRSKYKYLLRLAKENNVHFNGNYISGR